MSAKPLVLLLMAGVVLAAASFGVAPATLSNAAAGEAEQGVSPQSPNPLESVKLFTDPEAPSWQTWRSFTRRGERRKADLIWKIAREPKAIWLGRFTRPNFAGKIRAVIDRAKADGSVPVFTVLRAQANKCSPTYQGGGPREDRATRKWYDALARVLGDERVVIAFEPDSLGTIDCLARSRRDDRIRLLRHGVLALSRLPNATVYLEATQ